MLSQTYVEGAGALESCGLGWRMDLEALGKGGYVSGGGQASVCDSSNVWREIGFISVQKVGSCVPLKRQRLQLPLPPEAGKGQDPLVFITVIT